MPEEPEVDTDKLREAVHEEFEREGAGFLRSVALTTSILAALAALASLQAGRTVNEALALKTEATRLEVEAADQWSYYQAKGLKLAIQQSTAATWQAAGKAVPADYGARAARYAADQDSSRRAAQGFEKERDHKAGDADDEMRRHERYANAVALFQVAIALGAVAALTRGRPVWIGSMLLGIAGLVFALLAWR